MSRPQDELTLHLHQGLLDALAERVAARLLPALTQPQPASPWMNIQRACDYLGFSRNQLYKLTAAKAIPHRKRSGGQGLLFHRDELDRWVEHAYTEEGQLP